MTHPARAAMQATLARSSANRCLTYEEFLAAAEDAVPYLAVRAYGRHGDSGWWAVVALAGDRRVLITCDTHGSIVIQSNAGAWLKALRLREPASADHLKRAARILAHDGEGDAIPTRPVSADGGFR